MEDISKNEVSLALERAMLNFAEDLVKVDVLLKKFPRADRQWVLANAFGHAFSKVDFRVSGLLMAQLLEYFGDVEVS